MAGVQMWWFMLLSYCYYHHHHYFRFLLLKDQFTLCHLFPDKLMTRALGEVLSLSRESHVLVSDVTRKSQVCHKEMSSRGHFDMLIWSRKLVKLMTSHIMSVMIWRDRRQSDWKVFTSLQARMKVTSSWRWSHRLVSDVARKSASATCDVVDKFMTSPRGNNKLAASRVELCRVVLLKCELDLTSLYFSDITSD